MTREEKVRKAISVLMDCADAAKGTEFADYYLMGADSLRQQETVTNRNGLNDPLTLDELREMDGKPVWVVYGEDAGMWALVEVCEESIFLTNNLGGRTEYAANVELEDDGLTVYRQKPEEGTE